MSQESSVDTPEASIRAVAAPLREGVELKPASSLNGKVNIDGLDIASNGIFSNPKRGKSLNGKVNIDGPDIASNGIFSNPKRGSLCFRERAWASAHQTLESAHTFPCFG